MPRKLPWVADGTPKLRGKQSPAALSPAVQRHAKAKTTQVDHQADLVDSDLNSTGAGQTYVRPPERQHLPRSPSTSPPPAPPEVEFMREGYDADDIYLMVEDEFHTTAKIFTQHIHHAEYVRLKKLAQARGAQTLETLNRGVDGVTQQSTGLKLKLEAAESAKKKNESLKSVFGNDEENNSDDEDAYMMDPQLAGLMMTRDRVQGHDLSGVIQAKSHTRAAAGFSQSPGGVSRKRDITSISKASRIVPTSSKARKLFEEEAYSEEEGELDNVSMRRSLPTESKSKSSAVLQNSSETSGRLNKSIDHATSSLRIFKRFTEATYSEDASKEAVEADTSGKTTLRARHLSENTSVLSMKSREGRRSKAPAATLSSSPPSMQSKVNDKESSPASEDWLSPRRRSNVASDFLAKRRAERDKKRVKEEKTPQIDDIPTFIF